MVRSAEIAKVGIGIPEWCLYVYVQPPTPEEIASTAKYIVDHSDVARIATIAQDAAFSLIARDNSGCRVWNDNDIAMLSKRQRDVISRVLITYHPVAKPVLDAIHDALKGKSHDTIE